MGQRGDPDICVRTGTPKRVYHRVYNTSASVCTEKATTTTKTFTLYLFAKASTVSTTIQGRARRRTIVGPLWREWKHETPGIGSSCLLVRIGEITTTVGLIYRSCARQILSHSVRADYPHLPAVNRRTCHPFMTTSHPHTCCQR